MLIGEADTRARAPRPVVSPPAADGGDWPHTGRIMPWLLAAFVAMLWLVPFDSITLPVSLPFGLRLDRIFLGIILLAWIAAMLARPEARPFLKRMGWVDAVLLAFIGVAIVSVLVNAEMLAIQGEFTGAFKKVVLLAAYATFFYLVSSVLRPKEVAPFLKFVVVLACLTALGAIWEYRTGVSEFYTLANAIPGINVEQQPVDPQFGRELITGPTRHAIAIANMLAFALPVAVIGYMRSTTHRFWYGLATAIILCGAFATIRKTGALAPIAALFVIAAYRPRHLLRMAPLGIAIILVANFVVAPGSVSRVKAQLVTFDDQKSVEGRREDRPALESDIRTKPLLGRGHGSFESDRHRVLDNEYLQRLVETGYVGRALYFLLIVAVALSAHRVARSRSPGASDAGLAVVACAVVFAVVSAFYDVMSFPQAPYLFFLLAALAVVSEHGTRAGPLLRPRLAAPRAHA